MKPYYVELRVRAVVMADSEVDAMLEAEHNARDITFDAGLECDDAVEVTSLAHLQRLDQEWDGECIPYNGDGNTRLKDLLPETEPFKDTATADMFAV